MHVMSVSIGRAGHVDKLDIPDGAIEAIASGDYQRVSFIGRTDQGLAGVTLNVNSKRVSGHKLRPIPQELLNLVKHFSLDGAPEGLRAFARGEDVLIGDQTHGILLRWTGSGFEAFGAGLDTETLH